MGWVVSYWLVLLVFVVLLTVGWSVDLPVYPVGDNAACLMDLFWKEGSGPPLAWFYHG